MKTKKNWTVEARGGLDYSSTKSIGFWFK